MKATPFSIDVPENVLADLRTRLGETRFSHFPSESGWGTGTDPAFLRELVRYWRFEFDWRFQEARLNSLPQFCASIDGGELHFVHARARDPNATPLLLLHGWPDTFQCFHKLLPILTDPASAGADPHDAFHVVVPSLPGFALTGPVAFPPGVRYLRHSAELLFRLMSGLGYQRFAVAGGDCGSVCAQILAIDRPRAVQAVHLTDLGWHALDVQPGLLKEEERWYWDAARQRSRETGAALQVQRTRPRTLAAALNDSPVGLASWLADRFHEGSTADLEQAVGKDDLLTNVMLYWTTQTIGSSVLPYSAERRMPSLTPDERVERPVGFAWFPDSSTPIPPQSFAERTLNVERWRMMGRGGRFPALEVPALYARELFEFFRSHRGLVERDEPGERVRHDRPNL